MNSVQGTIDIGNRGLVFGGAYGNLQATEAIFSYADAHGFRRNQIIFTGDIVAYCGQPQETADLIRTSGCHIIMGNCEESLGAGRDDCGCGFKDGTECNILSAQWFSFCQSALNAETKSWMGTLPRNLTVKIGEYYFSSTHGTPETINQFVFPSDIDKGRYKIPQSELFDGYLVGHSGIPFISEDNGTLWVNSGAAGMPANDGGTEIWFATLENNDEILELQTHALNYEHDIAADAMLRANLNNGYRKCLKTGIWPSHDVLPEFEAKRAGEKIRPQKRSIEKHFCLQSVKNF